MRTIEELEAENADLKSKLEGYNALQLTPAEITRIIDNYGRGLTLRSAVGERVEIIREIDTDHLRELAKAYIDGRVIILPRNVQGNKIYDCECDPYTIKGTDFCSDRERNEVSE